MLWAIPDRAAACAGLWVRSPMKLRLRMMQAPDPNPKQATHRAAQAGSRSSPKKASDRSREAPRATARWSLRRGTIAPSRRPGKAEASCIAPCSEPAWAAEWPLLVRMDGSQPIIT